MLPLQVWNHPWVLKLDEDRKFERDERRRIFESDEDSLDGFIVFGSDEEVEEEERRKKKRKQNKTQLVRYIVGFVFT